MSVVSTTNTCKILKGAALAGNLSIFKEYACFGGKKTYQYVCISPNIEIFNYHIKFFELSKVNINKISDVIVKKENYLVLDYMIKRKFDENFVLSIIDRSIERKNINMIDYCIQKKYNNSTLF
jgi:hypothetical protein